MATILILGATGYVGGRLVPRLLEAGHLVRCLARRPEKLAGRSWSDQVTIVKGDVLDSEHLPETMVDVDIVYYLVHSMAHGRDQFERLERQAAENVVAATDQAGVKRIIYLGGLGSRDAASSPHLRSRHLVGDILRTGSAAVTEFRAAVIVGSGSLSFELIHHLVNRLPVMVCPRWVYSMTQPIAIRDVLAYLLEAVKVAESENQIIDIGGPEVLSYRDMMLTVARVLGLRRWLIQVPVLTPNLSSLWVNLVTPIRTSTARALIESVRHDTVVENRRAGKIFDVMPLPFEDAVRLAFQRRRDGSVETSWTNAESVVSHDAIDPSHLRTDERQRTVQAPAERVFEVIRTIGGDRGWYYGDWLWRIRGFLDQQVGGVGLRRGRRDPVNLEVGDALDFWRVEYFEPPRQLRLLAEMKVWGEAWLEFTVEPSSESTCTLTQSARYYPRGLTGLAYWYAVWPVHVLVFRGLIREIATRAETDPAPAITQER